MTDISQRFMDVVSQLLEPYEREAVLGDLAEAGESGWRGLVAVLGLIIRRQADLWRNWRPWLAAFGLAVPGSFLLMGFSVSVSHAYQQLVGPGLFRVTGVTVGSGFLLLLCNVIVLSGWAWTGGFVVGSVSRRTVWVSAALSFAPCLFCLERFRVESLSRLCLLLFLPPALWGVRRGLQIAHVKFNAAIVLAAGITVLSIPAWGSHGLWIPNWALSWPAWYLVATAQKPAWLQGRQSNGE